MKSPEPSVPREKTIHNDPRRKFEIDVMDTALPKASAIAWRAIVAKNDPPELFVIRRKPVRIVGGGPEEPVSTEYLGVDHLKGISARTSFWFKQTKEYGKREAHPVETVIRDMLSNAKPPLPTLDRIVMAPVCAADGLISIEPGYNSRSRTYFAKDRNLKLLPIWEQLPDLADVEAARDFILDEFLGDFPFVGDADRAHALSALLNPFVRSMIDGPTPLYLLEAPAAGTGKSLLASLLMVPGTGGPPITISPASNDEENRKALTSVLQRMPEAVLLDNVSKELKYPSLASALTADVWTDRILGRSESVSIPVRCSWLSTANNPTLSRELFRRVVRIRIDANAERPEQRSGFRIRRIEDWAAKNRGRLIDAALTLISNWILHGAMRSDHVLGSYDAWAGVHGGILECANVPGFLERRDADEAAVSPQESMYASFVDHWWEDKRTNHVGTSELFKIAQSIDDFYLGNSPTERGQKTSFGMTLTSLRDRVINGKRIHFVGKNQGLAQYQLSDITQAELPDPF